MPTPPDCLGLEHEYCYLNEEGRIEVESPYLEDTCRDGDTEVLEGQRRLEGLLDRSRHPLEVYYSLGGITQLELDTTEEE